MVSQDNLEHELEVNQIELCMQNEELCQAQLETEALWKKYMELYDYAPISLFTLDKDGLVLDVNMTGTVLLGTEKNYLLGNPFSHYVQSKFQDEFYLYCRRVLAANTRQKCELKLVKKDGTSFYGFLESINVQGFAGQDSGFLIAVNDLSDRKKVEDERSRAAKLESIGILAGGIAHDFNNFLTAIAGNIYLAKRETRSGEKFYNALEKAENACEHSFNLAQRLLTFAKGGSPIKKTKSIAEILKESSSLTLTGTSAQCLTYIPEDLWLAEVDGSQIGQVINNLLINAVQAMPDGGQSRSPVKIFICVKNTDCRWMTENM